MFILTIMEFFNMKIKPYLYILSLLTLICACSNTKTDICTKYSEINEDSIYSLYIPAGYSIDVELLGPLDSNTKDDIEMSEYLKENKEKPVIFRITSNILQEEYHKTFLQFKKQQYERDCNLKITEDIKNCFVIGKYNYDTKQISLESFMCSYNKEDYAYIWTLQTVVGPDVLTNIYDAISVDGFAEINGNKTIDGFPFKKPQKTKLIFKKAVRPIFFEELNKTRYRISGGNFFLRTINMTKKIKD